MRIISNRDRFKKAFFITIILIIFSFTSITFSIAEDQSWWDDDWGYREQIIIVNAGYSVLNNFPAYVKVPYKGEMQNNYTILGLQIPIAHYFWIMRLSHTMLHVLSYGLEYPH